MIITKKTGDTKNTLTKGNLFCFKCKILVDLKSLVKAL